PWRAGKLDATPPDAGADRTNATGYPAGVVTASWPQVGSTTFALEPRCQATGLQAVGVAAGLHRRCRGVPACRLRLDRRGWRCGPVRLGEADHDIEATVGSGADAQVRVVRGGDGRHDR